ncbi:hypothetical protein MBLNU457_6319t1 [Dothideomycetes sp. NU457]
MDPIPRNTPALMSKIDSLRNQLIRRFETLLELSSNEQKDRQTTALHQYQMQIETAGLIRASEDILSMTRQMQELWLFGQLKTLETDHGAAKGDDDAKAVAALLAQLTEADSNGVKAEKA